MATYELKSEDIFITTLVDKWMTQREQVETIDEEMNLDSLGKTKLLNAAYVSVNTDVKIGDEVVSIKGPKEKPVNELAVTIRQYLEDNGTDDETFVGLHTTIDRLLSEYKSRVDKYVDDHKKEVPDSDKPSEAQLAEMRETRKKLVDSMNGIRSLLEGTDANWWKDEGDALLVNADGARDKYENLRGAFGTRAPMGERLGAAFTYSVRDTDGQTTTSLTGKNLTDLKNFIKMESVAEMKKLIEEKNPGFIWKTPPDEFSFTFGKFEVHAVKNQDDSPEEDEPIPEGSEGPDIIMDTDDEENNEDAGEVFDDDDE